MKSTKSQGQRENKKRNFTTHTEKLKEEERKETNDKARIIFLID